MKSLEMPLLDQVDVQTNNKISLNKESLSCRRDLSQ
jgi:hypothetical protein